MIYYISERNLETNTCKWYKLDLSNPNINRHKHIMAFNAFFHGGGKYYRNWTNQRIIYAHMQGDQVAVDGKYLYSLSDRTISNITKLIEVDSMFDLFEHIGMDWKRKKYINGETLKRKRSIPFENARYLL